jgi:hypothetical protein
MDDNRKLAEEVCIENLAAYAHEAWSGWMKYQEKMGGNDFWETLPVELEKRWIRQANTDYADLPEEEKKSDRVEARRMLAIVEHAPNPLLPLIKELRDALAAAMRAMFHSPIVSAEFKAELDRLGIPDGIGVRANEAIKREEER